MAAALEEYGFGALYVNRDGYPRRGVGLVEELVASGRPVLTESPRGDLVAVTLSPSATPVLPEFRAARAKGRGKGRPDIVLE
jgi:hypothetical protein